MLGQLQLGIADGYDIPWICSQAFDRKSQHGVKISKLKIEIVNGKHTPAKFVLESLLNLQCFTSYSISPESMCAVQIEYEIPNYKQSLSNFRLQLSPFTFSAKFLSPFNAFSISRSFLCERIFISPRLQISHRGSVYVDSILHGPSLCGSWRNQKGLSPFTHLFNIFKGKFLN